MTQNMTFTAAQRTLMLRAHSALEKRIKFTNGGLAALGASSADVKRIELNAAGFKKELDDAHDREMFELPQVSRDVAVLALSILVVNLDAVRKVQLAAGVEDPEDTDATIEFAKNTGRQMKPEAFPLAEKQETLELAK